MHMALSLAAARRRPAQRRRHRLPAGQRRHRLLAGADQGGEIAAVLALGVVAVPIAGGGAGGDRVAERAVQGEAVGEWLGGPHLAERVQVVDRRLQGNDRPQHPGPLTVRGEDREDGGRRDVRTLLGSAASAVARRDWSGIVAASPGRAELRRAAARSAARR